MANNAGFQKMTPVENTVVGVLAGAIEVVLLQPILYCKNASQQGLGFTLDPRVLYRGLAMSVGNMAILTGLQFPLTGAVRSLMTGGKVREMSAAEQVASGFVGGALSGVACAPMELVLIQQQRFGMSLIATPTAVVEATGAMGLFRGLVTSCGREGVFTAGYMGLGPSLAQELRARNPDMSESMSKLGGSLGGGIIAGTLSHPMDTIKTCMQGDVKGEKYGSLTHTASVLMKEGGWRSFFRGWTWRTGRMCCALGIMSECKERFSPLLFPGRFE